MKKIVKRMMAVILASTMLMALTACGQDGEVCGTSRGKNVILKVYDFPNMKIDDDDRFMVNGGCVTVIKSQKDNENMVDYTIYEAATGKVMGSGNADLTDPNTLSPTSQIIYKAEKKDEGWNIELIGYDGQSKYSTTLESTGAPRMKREEVGKIIVVADTGSDEPLFYYDIDANKLATEEEYEADRVDYDHDQWGWYERCDAINGYYIATPDMSRYGFADADGNVINLYADASQFTDEGYALVSNDRSHYDLIDSDFNVVKADCFEGTAGYCIYGSHVFYVASSDGSGIYYVIENEK